MLGRVLPPADSGAVAVQSKEMATRDFADDERRERAAAGVDQIRPPLHPAERRRVEDVLGGGGVRQQRDDHVAAAEESLERVVAGEALDAVNLLRRAAPARDREAERDEMARDLGPERAEAEDEVLRGAMIRDREDTER